MRGEMGRDSTLLHGGGHESAQRCWAHEAKQHPNKTGAGRGRQKESWCWCQCAWAVARGGRDERRRAAPSTNARRPLPASRPTSQLRREQQHCRAGLKKKPPVSAAVRCGQRARARGVCWSSVAHRAPWASPRRAERPARPVWGRPRSRCLGRLCVAAITFGAQIVW